MAYQTSEGKYLCYACMRKMDTPDGICTCGFDNRTRENSAGFLRECVLKDRYYVGKSIGKGGFGITYHGYDLKMDFPVAIKEYFPQGAAYRSEDGTTIRSASLDEADDYRRGLRRAVREARMAAQLSDVQNVVRVIDFIEENGTIYIVMEYVDGRTLSDIVNREGQMRWDYARKLMLPIVNAICSLHERGILHRDISPDNIIKHMSLE